MVFPGEAAQACQGVTGLCARHPSQLYEALLEGVVLGAALLFLAWRRGWLKMPGALTGLFLMGYGLSRAFVDLFRQPDEQFVSVGNPIGHAFHLGDLGLTMGQALSVPMIVVELALVLYALQRVENVSRHRPDTTA